MQDSKTPKLFKPSYYRILGPFSLSFPYQLSFVAQQFNYYYLFKIYCWEYKIIPIFKLFKFCPTRKLNPHNFLLTLQSAMQFILFILNHFILILVTIKSKLSLSFGFRICILFNFNLSLLQMQGSLFYGSYEEISANFFKNMAPEPQRTKNYHTSPSNSQKSAQKPSNPKQETISFEQSPNQHEIKPKTKQNQNSDELRSNLNQEMPPNVKIVRNIIISGPHSCLEQNPSPKLLKPAQNKNKIIISQQAQLPKKKCIKKRKNIK